MSLAFKKLGGREGGGCKTQFGIYTWRENKGCCKQQSLFLSFLLSTVEDLINCSLMKFCFLFLPGHQDMYMYSISCIVFQDIQLFLVGGQL